MRGQWLLAASALVAMSGCTSYVSVPHSGGNWAEARRAAYGAGSAPSAVAAASPSAAPAAADWGRPPPAGADPLAPKPLAPLADDAAAAGARDVPVVEAPATRVVMAPEPAPAPRPVPVPEAVEPAAVTPEPEPERPATARAGRGTDVAAGLADPLPPPALSGVGFLWPVPSLAETATVRESGDDGGLVIDAGAGEPFVASENGVVVFAADALETFGNMVVVRHDGDYTTAYAHADSLDVDVGDVVRRGQRLGTVGATGAASAPQLYFEMRVGSRVVDPRAYLVGTPQLASR